MELTVNNYTDRVGNEFLRVRNVDKNGEEVVRILTVPQFCSYLGHSLVEDVQLVKVKDNFWPQNTIERYFGDYDNYVCTWIVEPAVRVVVFGNKHYHVPFPRLVFKIRVSKGSVVAKKCYALKNGDDKTLYQYPFGNVSGSGHICTGNIKIEGLDEAVCTFSEEFFLGKTNNDYYGDGTGRVKPACSQAKLLEKLEKLDVFPEKWLVKTGTIDDLLEKAVA
ncbi:hypothetical protein [Butyrivibrio hungatei]|uniref:PRTRC system protein B n=1 Tax=Butyrivibrio hungatei TaxID=185008 RepID=A0A1D9P6T2_9FIRM|nr:hypothetical protein [Butyrivibrio hungatei]AOZ97855.1 hypothetical protein bhn_II056 [Butyrivibrio hungatei]